MQIRTKIHIRKQRQYISDPSRSDSMTGYPRGNAMTTIENFIAAMAPLHEELQYLCNGLGSEVDKNRLFSVPTEHLTELTYWIFSITAN